MSNLQFPSSSRYRFRPSWLGTLITLCCIPLFIKLGLWQYHKAEQKQALQDSYERYRQAAPVPLPSQFDDLERWRYRAVTVNGSYQPDQQILLDNQVEQEVAGYHVLTPLRISGSDRMVLVDRGWVPALADHSQTPQVQTPTGEQHISGKLWLPSSKFYSLEAKGQDQAGAKWQPVWQNLDMQRLQAAVPAMLPVVVRLDADSAGGGFVRNWIMPADRIGTNIGYAYQWFGFAVAALLIYLYVSIKKVQA